MLSCLFALSVCDHRNRCIHYTHLSTAPRTDTQKSFVKINTGASNSNIQGVRLVCQIFQELIRN